MFQYHALGHTIHIVLIQGIYAWFNNGQRQTEGKAVKDYGLCYDDPTVWRTE